jgi:hypothetical protein
MKKLILLFLIASLLVVGCQPSATATPVAELTASPCTDRGWAEITNYLYEFDQQLNDADPKADVGVLVGQLEKTTTNIKAVGIDSCTEQARNLLIKGLGDRIRGVKYVASGENDSARIVMRDGFRFIILASEMLQQFGIDLKYPKN